MAPAPSNLRATGIRIEQLVEQLSSQGDPATFAKTEELLRLVTEYYGAGLARIVELVGEAAPELLQALASDGLIGSLLLVHELHPESLDSRLAAAISSVEPLLSSHGGGVELLEVDAIAGAVRLRLTGSCEGCPSSTLTLRSAVEAAISERAPEIYLIEVEPPSQAGTEIVIGPKPAAHTACPAALTAP